MKQLYVLFLPRQVTTLFLILCSCHMVLIVNWIRIPSGEVLETISEDTEASSLKENAVLESFPYSSRNSLSSNKVQPVLKGLNRIDKTHNTLAGVTGSREITGQRHILGLLFANASEKVKQSFPKLTMHGYKDSAFDGHRITDDILFMNKSLQISSEVQNLRVQKSVKDKRPWSFNYLINPRFMCSDDDENNVSVHSIILVHSHPANKPQREAIRSTWGKRAKRLVSDIQFRLVFVLGISDRDSSNYKQYLRVQREATLYNDILLGEFDDTYQNLTLKSLFALQWVSDFCDSTQYSVKTDDDTFLYTEPFRTLMSFSRNTSLFGALNVNAKVMRSGQWNVPHELYPDAHYPPYCTGCIYVLSTQIIADLLKAAEHTKVIPVEDVFITGILPHIYGLTCSNHDAFPQWFVSTNHKNKCELLKKNIIALHNVPFEQMFKIQDMLDGKYNSNICHADISKYS